MHLSEISARHENSATMDQKPEGHSKKGRKRVSFDRTAEYPQMEEALYKEYQKLHQHGLKVKGWWFRTRGQQLL